MDTENVVEKIRITMKEFVSQKGEFSLVMLIPTEASVIDSNVTLLVSAPWLVPYRFRTAIKNKLFCCHSRNASVEAASKAFYNV